MARKVRGIAENFARLIKQKLIVPILRSPHPPVYKARGVAVGLAVAMTPLIGIQMWMVLLIWMFAKKCCKWDFSLPLGLAWTWVTNVFTMIPVYYLFYISGQIMRGNFASIKNYNNIAKIVQKNFAEEIPFMQQWANFFNEIVKDWGISMMIGCVPWLIISAVAGYYFTLKFEKARLAFREKRMQKNKLKMKKPL